jgi:hypothetical protein
VQKIFSTRLDEAVLDEMDRVTRRLKITKRRFLEEAIHRQAVDLAGKEGTDVWDETLGAWDRKETPGTTVRRARAAFQRRFSGGRPDPDARIRR